MGNLALISKATSVLEADISLTFDDGSVKTLKVKEGEKVNDLVYVVNGKMETVTGFVRVINTTETKVNTPASCVHNTTSVFSRKVTIQSLTIDASKEYESNVVVVPVAAIKDFTTTDLTPMTVSNVALENPTLVAVTSTVKPVVAIWNDEEVVIPTQGDEDNKYVVPVVSIKKINTITLLDKNSTYTTTVEGVDPEAIIPSAVTEEFSAVSTIIFNDYYNKYTSGDVIVPETDKCYVKVASGLGVATEATFNGETYSADKDIRVSVGNNAFITTPAFKVEDGNLYIAAPILYAMADDDGNIVVNINGFNILVDLPLQTNAIVLDSVVALGGKEGYLNNAYLDTEAEVLTGVHERQDGTAHIGWLLKVDGQPVAPHTKAFTKKVYSDGSETSYGVLDMVGDEIKTDSTYNYWISGAIETPYSRVIGYTITIPSIGRIKFNLDIRESKKEVTE